MQYKACPDFKTIISLHLRGRSFDEFISNLLTLAHCRDGVSHDKQNSANCAVVNRQLLKLNTLLRRKETVAPLRFVERADFSSSATNYSLHAKSDKAAFKQDDNAAAR
jgi:hypothetical protein